MKKKMIVFIGMTALAAGMMGCGNQNESREEPRTESVATTAEAKVETKNVQSAISEEEAKQIALKDAGVKESDVSGMRIKLETDDGTKEYEVDFYVGDKEYDYDIDASDGTIRSKDTEIEDDFGTDRTDVKVSKDTAIKKVLAKVKGAQESDVRIHLDEDDGRQIYEGSVIYEEMEYDFEIDASTGKILEWEAESVYDD
ncbi:MAG: PepSY domain-containing protein [Anaerostipes sp.]|uniref:PepSY domain-containing protein n=1 Tax=Anaerostipes sp. 992a TaxID=1261637 RepID=UPI0009533D98|nr:PepSY domain-containing protein [Anaerostipes sp. 992a]MCI5951745.1 PepSY domain-containing protein [Anaerostipes sp.]MDD5969514.1 PepSY domain-containing protein [Anaerostipes sp.]OLR62066.1 hypothetical protein BHF69_04850 [Anaerostipes sp. 992a]